MTVSGKRYTIPAGMSAVPPSFWGKTFDVITPSPGDFEKCGDYAVVCVTGPLSQRHSYETDSYACIVARVRAALASDCPAVCLRLDSPGGDFSGCIEAATEIRALAKANGKPFIAFVDANALSAGYALACAADEIVVTPTGFVGSIGVWAMLQDCVAADRAMGVNAYIASSGKAKTDTNPHVPITDGAKARLDAQVDAMAAVFFAHVKERRSLSVDEITSYEGATYFGKHAIAVRLADRVVDSWASFMSTPVRSAVMAGYDEAMSQMRSSMRKMAEGEGEDSEKARAWLAEDAKKNEPKAEDDGEKKEEKKEPEAKKAKAADEEAEKKAEEKEEKEMKAQALLAKAVHEARAEIAALKNSMQAKEDAAYRATLLSSRPDFSAEILATLAKAPIAMVEDAVKNWARVATGGVAGSNAALTPGATRGAGQETGVQTLASEDQKAIDRAFGGPVGEVGVSFKGRALTLGQMTQEQAREFLASRKDGVK